MFPNKRLMTINDLEDFINIVSGDDSNPETLNKQKVARLQNVISGLFPALENMIVYSDEMPRKFYVDFTTEMAEKVWEQSTKDQPEEYRQLLLVNLQTLFFSLIDISGVLLDNRELIFIKKLAMQSDVYRNVPVNTNIPDVLIALKREFLGMFKQQELLNETNELMKDITDRKALFEYMTARNVMRTKPELANAYREFY